VLLDVGAWEDWAAAKAAGSTAETVCHVLAESQRREFTLRIVPGQGRKGEALAALTKPTFSAHVLNATKRCMVAFCGRCHTILSRKSPPRG